MEQWGCAGAPPVCPDTRTSREGVMTTRRPARWPAPLVALALCAAPLPAQTSPEAGKAPDRATPPARAQPEFPAPATVLDPNLAPISLAAALQLAGVQNPELLLARERITEAAALRQLAAAQFLPSINVGTNLDLHTGPLQASTGTILKVNRGSLYLGLGSGAVGTGTVTIPGVFWNANLAEAITGALVTRQVVRQREFAAAATGNDVLLRVATAYLELLR